MDLKMGAQTRSFFGHLAPFFYARRPWEPKWPPSPKSPQDQSKPRFPSILGWFWTIVWWFSVSCGLLFIWFASLLFWLPRAFVFKFLATSSNVLGSSAGVNKDTKNAMWPTFCLACLFVFVTSSPTFQVSGHRFSGSSVELLANCGRWHGGGNAEGKWITLIG